MTIVGAGAIVASGGTLAPLFGISFAAGTASPAAAAVGGGLFSGAFAGTTAASASSGAIATATSYVSSFFGPPAVTLVSSGPVGWAVLGTSSTDNTFDCWKQVLHDESTEKSNGKLLRDVIVDSRVKEVKIQQNNEIVEFEIENIWNEKFNIVKIDLPNDENKIFLHAIKI